MTQLGWYGVDPPYQLRDGSYVADTRGVVVITTALIGAAATIIAALITQSDREPTTPKAAPPVVSDTTTPSIQPETAQPEPPIPARTTQPASALSGDLGVSRAITRPACDGRFVVFTGAVVHPPTYRSRVQELLDIYPGSEYLRASDTCPSLRSRNNAGNEIYGVYFGPFVTREQACRARGSWAGDSYVKVLDTVTDSGVIIKC